MLTCGTSIWTLQSGPHDSAAKAPIWVRQAGLGTETLRCEVEALRAGRASVGGMLAPRNLARAEP